MIRQRYIFVLAFLLGIALLYEGVRRYTGLLDRRDTPSPPIGTTVRSSPRPTGPRAPDSSEIAGLEDPDPRQRARFIDVLMYRAYTPEVISAVEDRLAQPQPPVVEEKLRCLKAHFPGEGNLDLAIKLLPADAARDGDSVMVERLRCQVEAIAAHATENPDRVRAALVEFSLSSRVPIRSAAMQGLARIPPAGDIPVDVRVKAASPDPQLRREGIQAAMALGAAASMPGLIERALDDPEPSVREAVRVPLELATDQASARAIARAIAQRPNDQMRLQLFRARDVKAHGDVSGALAALALDASAPAAQRQGALDALRTQGDVGVLPLIAPLRRDADAAISAHAQAAGVELEQRQARGVPSLKP